MKSLLHEITDDIYQFLACLCIAWATLLFLFMLHVIKTS
jgi:hypothetical protein